MLLGKVDSGQHMASLDSAPIGDSKNVIDVVVFVTDIDSGSSQIAALKQFFKLAQETGKLVVVAITKVDKILDGKPIDQAGTHPKYTALCGELYKLWETTARGISIWPVANYGYGVKKKDLPMEELSFGMLQWILDKFSTKQIHVFSETNF